MPIIALTAFASYFGGRAFETANRIRHGAGARAHEAEDLANAATEWNDRCGFANAVFYSVGNVTRTRRTHVAIDGARGLY